MDQFYKDHKDKGLIVLGMSHIGPDDDSKEKIIGLREKHFASFPQVFDESDIFDQYKVKGVPYMVLVNPEGSTEKILIGGQETNEFESFVSQLLKRKIEGS